MKTAKKLKDAPKPVVKKLERKRNVVHSRFPILFTLLGTFGVVATFYGFEGLIDSTSLKDHPFVLLCIGLLTLIITGTLYKKLD